MLVPYVGLGSGAKIILNEHEISEYMSHVKCMIVLFV